MTDWLAEALPIFSRDDGSLPEVEFDVSNAQDIRAAYLFLQSCACRIESRKKAACYWSKSKGVLVPIGLGDDPVPALMSGDTDPLHIVFGGIRSPSGQAVPALGIFVFCDALAIDYRMGSDWDSSAILGLFEILDRIAEITGASKFAHRDNDNENDEGDRLLRLWTRWRTLCAE